MPSTKDIIGAIKKIPMDKIIKQGKKAVPILQSIAGNKELQSALEPALQKAVGEKNAETAMKITNIVSDPTYAVIELLKKKLEGIPIRDIYVEKDSKGTPYMIVFEMPYMKGSSDDFEVLLSLIMDVAKKVLPHKLLVNDPKQNYSKLFLCKRAEDCQEHL